MSRLPNIRLCEKCSMVNNINKKIMRGCYTFSYYDFYNELPTNQEYVYFEQLFNSVVTTGGYKVIAVVHELVPLYVIAPQKLKSTVDFSPLPPPRARPSLDFFSLGDHAI